MAYRRSLTTRAKFLYQQKGVSPAIFYCHNDDRKNHELPSRENPRIPSFFQPHYVRSGINSFTGSRNPFQDWRFCAPQLMIPMNSGSMFTRNMSSSVGGGAEKIEYISEVAELADKAVEAVASQVPAVNEVAIAAADSFLPVQALQYLIDYVHIFTGLDWWASIIATTILIRCITLPLMINQLKATSKFAILKPKLDAINEEMQNRCNAQEGLEGNPSAKTIKNVSRAFAALTIPFTAGFPKPIRGYYYESLTGLYLRFSILGRYGLIKKASFLPSLGGQSYLVPIAACWWEVAVVKNPAVKKFLGVPIVPVTPPSEQKPGLPFFETLKKYAAAQKQLAAQQHAQSSPAVASKPASQVISSSSSLSSSSSVLGKRIASLEKQVKRRKNNKKRR
ncbi:hypothetical protein BC332_20345 [Capsicum chinense]|nr:hypothetical protein BC332_20345 [Capsicum chinense]